MLSFLRREPDLYLQTLTFEPLNLEEVHARYTAASTAGAASGASGSSSSSSGGGIGGGGYPFTRVSKPRLLEILDSLAVFVSTGTGASSKRRQGKGGKRHSPKKRG